MQSFTDKWGAVI